MAGFEYFKQSFGTIIVCWILRMTDVFLAWAWMLMDPYCQFLIYLVFRICSVYMVLTFSECANKTYGAECKELCGNCSNGEPCHHVDGTCPHGCDAGMYGDKCDLGNMNIKFSNDIFYIKFVIFKPFSTQYLKCFNIEISTRQYGP